MKKTQTKKEKLEKELAELKEIAGREKLKNTTFADVYNSYDFPPYALAAVTFYGIAEDVMDFEPVADKTEDGRVRGNAEKAFLNGLGRVGQGCGYAVAGYTAAFVGALTTPIALPRLAGCAAKSAINKNYNRRIDKAKVRVAEIEKELKEMNAAEQAQEM